jgi:GntR family transcriptional repressor for pyruvate dehydrogenase complex
LNEQRRELIKTIYTALKNGEISKGNQVLSERELADKFQVKRTTLREALISLEALGIIEIRERQGIFVGEGGLLYLTQGLDMLSAYSPVDIFSQVFEVRIMVETLAAELAAQRRTERDLSLLWGEIDFFRNLCTTNHPEKGSLGSQHNAIFHNLLITATHNIVLQRIYEGISKLTQNVFTALGDSSLAYHPYAIWPDILLKEHEDLVKAIAAGDSEAAKASLLLHLENSKSRNQDAVRMAQLLLVK